MKITFVTNTEQVHDVSVRFMVASARPAKLDTVPRRFASAGGPCVIFKFYISSFAHIFSINTIYRELSKLYVEPK